MPCHGQHQPDATINAFNLCEGSLHQSGVLTFAATRQSPRKSWKLQGHNMPETFQLKPNISLAAWQERFTDFKKQVDALTQQVNCLTHDKECLKSRNELLETMMEEELKCAGGATRALTSGQAVEPTDPSSSEEVSSLPDPSRLIISETCWSGQTSSLFIVHIHHANVSLHHCKGSLGMSNLLP